MTENYWKKFFPWDKQSGMKSLLLLFLLFFFVSNGQSQLPLKLVKQEVRLKNKTAFSLLVPEGYRIAVAAEGLNRPRFFCVSPDGRLFITDMFDRSDNKKGKVLILEDWADRFPGPYHYYANRRHMPDALRCCVDFIEAEATSS